ncbi:hypothetical protein EJ06DRAFT_525773 [Trichodelitschia bisporula]|uniref:Pre-mRNA-splicing factor cef1 n=1 Tax=Trichodelitschia bisporula TaxID=703511 RepID=A0A6G1IAP0_9PEZI|nr:hypothetical protein EJ06DRAFT_525773 [Trichodelitschia bisporula]
MVTVKGGVWTNIEDEILKASISKYGLNQWARVSSLLARKTPKQCKARWSEWLDPQIKKIEWSKEEDEKLLHLAKLMPTQWRTIAPIVGRTATQCLERYQKLLDEAEAREAGDLALGGPSGGETVAPSADDVRKLRPGELDPDPESKPARPDTVDLDEDEKEMLSEARARLANTQGKKAKRKARERQLEESRRVASLQKRRELKMSGINIKLKTFKKGEMDYNADIPFERAPAPGFYDTGEELDRNERQREAFDPRKQQLANKRKGEHDDEGEERKRKKNDKANEGGLSAAAIKAAQMQKIREAEQSSMRRPLVLPAPQVSDAELEDIIKMGFAGERAAQVAGNSEYDATRGLIGNYSNMAGATPIRTPRAPQEEDRVANEIRNARALTDTQSALLGGDNAPLVEGSGSTGFGGAAPSKQAVATPNPLATPFRQGVNGIGSTPLRGPGATPLRTPRDSLSLNQDSGMQLVSQTPRDMKLREQAVRKNLLDRFAALPKPKELEFELELPEEQQEVVRTEVSIEDAALRDRRERQLRQAAELTDFKRQTQVVQMGLPRPTIVDVDAMLRNAEAIQDPTEKAIAVEAALLIAHDGRKFGGSKISGTVRPLQDLDDDLLGKARAEVSKELSTKQAQVEKEEFVRGWMELHSTARLPGLDGYFEDEIDEHQLMVEAFDSIQERIMADADRGNEVERKLVKVHGGYVQRAKMLRQKITEAADALEKTRIDLNTALRAQVGEEAAIARRLEGLRDEVAFISRRGREGQEAYRAVRDELEGLGAVNGHQ